jgi:hypothetical protein
MTKFLKEFLRAQVSMTTLVLVMGIWLLLQGTANAAVTLCTDSIPPNFPTPPVNQPNPAETRAIEDLVSRYGLALENKDSAILADILDPNVTFEVCRAGGNIQDFKATDRPQVEAYYNDLWPALTSLGLTTQHIFSKLILNKTGPDTVEGAFTQLVFLQTSFGALNPDYSGRIKAAFVRQAGDWRIQSFLLISFIPDLGGGIGTTAR